MSRATTLLSTVLLTSCSALTAQEPSIEDAFSRVERAVVTIRTVSRQPEPRSEQGFTAVGGVGSGVLISREGDVLTAAHVVQAADALMVEFPDGRRVNGRVVASHPAADVARVRLTGTVPVDIEPAVLADSDRVRTGSRVLVVGAPLGISHTLTVGHISARRNLGGLLGSAEEVEFFQTDAAINEGNSGGPLVNVDGEVIGVVSHIATTTGGSQGLGFAVTANVARQLVVDGPAIWSGIEGLLIDGDLARALNTPAGTTGLLVQRVALGSPAAELGIEGGRLKIQIEGRELLIGGDVVLAAQGIGLDPGNEAALREALSALGPDDELVVTVWRAGQAVELRGTLGASAAGSR